jgi:hypothetical protein
MDHPSIVIMEDDEAKPEPERKLDPRLRLEEGEEVMELDEETRAAVRMSIYGAPSSAEPSLRQLSPNVVPCRKGTVPPGPRKKRRPSYWDGDLEQVVQSPAARHVVSSPIKKDDVQSMQAEVEGQEKNECQMVNKEALKGRRSRSVRRDVHMKD